MLRLLTILDRVKKVRQVEDRVGMEVDVDDYESFGVKNRDVFMVPEERLDGMTVDELVEKAEFLLY